MALRDQIIRAAIAILLAVNIYFAAVEPCTSAESVVYERYASRDILEAWKQPLDLHLGLVYGVLARIATRLGGVSELTIRIPALLGGLLFWLGLAAVCRRFSGWWSLAAFLTIAANPWTFRAFSAATGAALALGLLATAVRYPRKAALFLGLAAGSDVLAALSAAAFVMPQLWGEVDAILLPAVLLGSFLISPAILIPKQPVAAADNDGGTRQLIKTLPHTSPVRLGVSPRMEPAAFFYRRRYHLDWIQIVPIEQPASYLLIASPEQAKFANAPWRLLKKEQNVLLLGQYPKPSRGS